MILHRVDLSTSLTDKGVHIYRRHGEAVDVSGRLYVDEQAGAFLVPADGWHAVRAAALTEAADRLLVWAHLLMNQAEELLREASE
jgi:hypothetical protein